MRISLEFTGRLPGEYLIWVEYGLQSANDNTLAFINRGHDFSCFKNAVKITRQRGIKVCAHVILGFPGETRDDMINTAKAVSDAGIDGIKIHLYMLSKTRPLRSFTKKGGINALPRKNTQSLYRFSGVPSRKCNNPEDYRRPPQRRTGGPQMGFG